MIPWSHSLSNLCGNIYLEYFWFKYCRENGQSVRSRRKLAVHQNLFENFDLPLQRNASIWSFEKTRSLKGCRKAIDGTEALSLALGWDRAFYLPFLRGPPELLWRDQAASARKKYSHPCSLYALSRLREYVLGSRWFIQKGVIFMVYL